MTKILLTGATGYIGSRVAEHLSAHFDVSVLHRRTSSLGQLNDARENIRLFPVDDMDSSSVLAAVRASAPDVVVHLAAMTRSSHELIHVTPLLQSNVIFGSNLLESMVQCGVHGFVNTGSFWEFLNGGSDYLPLNLYAASKRAFQDILRYYEDAHSIRAVTLSLFGVYGPHDPRGRMFSLFRTALTAEEPILLSPGEQKLDLIHVADVVRAYASAVDFVMRKNDSVPLTVPIGSGEEIRMKDVASVYERIVEKRLNIRWGGVPYRAREMMSGRADLTAARTVLGWSPSLFLEEGIQDMLRKDGVLPK